MYVKSDMTVLVVDDTVIMRKAIVNALKAAGFKKIVEAEDGQQAFNLVKDSYNDPSNKIGIIFTDWYMPNRSGFEFLRDLKATAELKKIPVVFITSEAEKSNVLTAILAGADDYIVKPISAEKILDKIRAINKKYGGTAPQDKRDSA